MYNFIFFFIYSQQIQKGKSELFSLLNGRLIVWLAVGIHIGFIFSIYRKIFFQGNEGYGNQYSGIITLFIFVLAILVNIYYSKKRVANILVGYSGELISMSTWNITKMLLLIFAPLITLMILSVKPMS
jgi:hypothetical protein